MCILCVVVQHRNASCSSFIGAAAAGYCCSTELLHLLLALLQGRIFNKKRGYLFLVLATKAERYRYLRYLPPKYHLLPTSILELSRYPTYLFMVVLRLLLSLLLLSAVGFSSKYQDCFELLLAAAVAGISTSR